MMIINNGSYCSNVYKVLSILNETTITHKVKWFTLTVTENEWKNLFSFFFLFHFLTST